MKRRPLTRKSGGPVTGLYQTSYPGIVDGIVVTSLIRQSKYSVECGHHAGPRVDGPVRHPLADTRY